MHILLRVLQIFLALHTIMGAVWKFSNSEQTVPSLSAIPHGAWLGMSIFEFLCSAGLLIPLFKKSLAKLVPLAAAGIAAEMLIFCVLHVASGDSNTGPMIYWLVVAALCGFIGYSRMKVQVLYLPHVGFLLFAKKVFVDPGKVSRRGTQSSNFQTLTAGGSSSIAATRPLCVISHPSVQIYIRTRPVSGQRLCR